MFDDLVESSVNRRGRSRSTVLISFVVHALVVLIIIVIPLIYYQALPEQELLAFLVPPPPPPPPPPATPQVRQQQQVVRLDPSAFVAPQEIPTEIPPPMDDIPDISTISLTAGGVPGGVPGGVVGGVPGGVPGGVIGAPSAAPPPPPPPERKEPIRVGGNVQASRLIRRVEPEYPELAKRARVQGIVLLQVTVDERGQVADVNIIRGHPLLNQSAVDAVRQWVYSPTLLNNEPVPVIATVTVNFVLR